MATDSCNLGIPSLDKFALVVSLGELQAHHPDKLWKEVEGSCVLHASGVKWCTFSCPYYPVGEPVPVTSPYYYRTDVPVCRDAATVFRAAFAKYRPMLKVGADPERVIACATMTVFQAKRVSKERVLLMRGIGGTGGTVAQNSFIGNDVAMEGPRTWVSTVTGALSSLGNLDLGTFSFGKTPGSERGKVAAARLSAFVGELVAADVSPQDYASGAQRVGLEQADEDRVRGIGPELEFGRQLREFMDLTPDEFCDSGTRVESVARRSLWLTSGSNAVALSFHLPYPGMDPCASCESRLFECGSVMCPFSGFVASYANDFDVPVWFRKVIKRRVIWDWFVRWKQFHGWDDFGQFPPYIGELVPPAEWFKEIPRILEFLPYEVDLCIADNGGPRLGSRCALCGEHRFVHLDFAMFGLDPFPLIVCGCVSGVVTGSGRRYRRYLDLVAFDRKYEYDDSESVVCQCDLLFRAYLGLYRSVTVVKDQYVLCANYDDLDVDDMVGCSCLYGRFMRSMVSVLSLIDGQDMYDGLR